MHEENKIFLIALAPIIIEYSNVIKNQQTIRKAINKAIEMKAEVICFPEYCTTGYDYSKDLESSELAQSLENNHFIDELKKISFDSNLDIVIGVLLKQEDKIFNSGLYFTQGRLIHVHYKIREGGPISSGKNVQSFQTKLGKVAIIICGDLFTDSVIDNLKNERPDIVFMPMDRCLHELAMCGKYNDQCENVNCLEENKLKQCYQQGFRSYDEVWKARVKYEYANQVKKFGVTTVIVNGLSSCGHELACGGALHIGQDGKILDEIIYGQHGIKIIKI